MYSDEMKVRETFYLEIHTKSKEKRIRAHWERNIVLQYIKNVSESTRNTLCHNRTQATKNITSHLFELIIQK